jgi:putative transposase
MAANRQFPPGARGRGVSLRSDHGGQPTAMTFMQACATLASHQTVTRDNNPKGNADTERFMRTLKAECLWRQEWTCPLALLSALDQWINDYNTVVTPKSWTTRQLLDKRSKGGQFQGTPSSVHCRV